MSLVCFNAKDSATIFIPENSAPTFRQQSPVEFRPHRGGRFTPGQIIAQRYRVVALAGRGGMGEVYRAEDLTLGQVVALSFFLKRLFRYRCAREVSCGSAHGPASFPSERLPRI